MFDQCSPEILVQTTTESTEFKSAERAVLDLNKDKDTYLKLS